MSAAGILAPWFGPGQHPACPSNGMYAEGVHRCYRVFFRRGVYVAEFSTNHQDWEELCEEPFRTAYAGCDACGQAELRELAARITPQPFPCDLRGMSAVERLDLVRGSRR